MNTKHYHTENQYFTVVNIFLFLYQLHIFPTYIVLFKVFCATFKAFKLFNSVTSKTIPYPFE